MVKDDGTEQITTGPGRYFLNFRNYSVNEDPLHIDTHYITAFIPLRDLTFERPGLKQIIPIHPECNVIDLNEDVIEEIEISIKEEFGEKGYFHYKSQGITIIAEDVDISDSAQRITINIANEKTQGIIDGGNLYNIIREMSKDEIANNTYLKVNIITTLKPKVVSEIIHSLDTKITNKKELTIKSSELKWLKDIVDQTEYKDKIKLVDVLSYIHLLRNNIFDADAFTQPTDSYANKQQIIEEYKKNPGAFKSFAPLVKDILWLHDYINVKTMELWPSKLGSMGSLGLSLPYKQKAYAFPMMNKKEDYKFHEAIICVLLNGFRCFVIFNIDGQAQWSKGFSKITKIYEQIAVELLTIIKTYNKETGYNPHVLGTNTMLYSIIYKEMMMGDMLNQFL